MDAQYTELQATDSLNKISSATFPELTIGEYTIAKATAATIENPRKGKTINGYQQPDRIAGIVVEFDGIEGERFMSGNQFTRESSKLGFGNAQTLTTLAAVLPGTHFFVWEKVATCLTANGGRDRHIWSLEPEPVEAE